MTNAPLPAAADVAAALEPVRQALLADGYDMACEVDGDHVVLRVVAGSDACEECLVGKTVMASMVEAALARRGLAVPTGRLALRYPGEV